MAQNPIFGENVVGHTTFQVTTFHVPSVPIIIFKRALPSQFKTTSLYTLGILKVVGHRQAATAIRTTFPGGPKSQKPMDGREKPF